MYMASSFREKFPLHLVHVDHGWRKESNEEALRLQEKAKKLNLPFHLCVLDPASAVGNLENWSRQERYVFFEKVGKMIGTQWLLLGHHKDDSVEVVLRRILDGSHLIHAAGMPFHSSYGYLTLLRPLISFEKEYLLSYLKEKGVTYIHDPTNEDIRFQRAAMRKVLFPSLFRCFGKNIQSSLHQLSKEASFLREHVEEEIGKKFHWTHTPRAIMCAKKHHESYSRFLLMQAIHSACCTLGAPLSREQEMRAVEILRENTSTSKFFSTKKASLYVDADSFLLLTRKSLKLLPIDCSLGQEGVFTVGSWTISLAKELGKNSQSYSCPALKASSEEKQQANALRDLFLDGFHFMVEKLPLQIVASNEKNMQLCPGKKNTCVPASLRRHIPLFLQEGKVVAAPCCGWRQTDENIRNPFVVTVTLDWHSDF